jgi:hypothetical protein
MNNNEVELFIRTNFKGDLVETSREICKASNEGKCFCFFIQFILMKTGEKNQVNLLRVLINHFQL